MCCIRTGQSQTALLLWRWAINNGITTTSMIWASSRELFLVWCYDTPPIFFSFHLICIWLVEKWIPHHHQAFWCLIRIETKKTNSTRSLLGLLFSFALRVIQIGEFIQLDVACSWNRRKPRKLEPCRRLLRGWDPPFPRDRATGAAAARGSTVSSTE